MALTKTDTLNYRGELFLIGNNQTPFMQAIAPRAMRSASFTFSMAQPWALNAAAQPAISEDASVTAQTPVTYTRGEDTNTAQIDMIQVAVSLKKQSTFGLMSGINTNQANPITDELTFQKGAALRQLAINMEKSFISGSYQAATNTGTAAKTRGILESITTNAVAASSAPLSRALVDQLLRTMYSTGSAFQTPAFFVNGYQKQQLSKIYEYVPQSRSEGGSNIQLIETDMGIFRVVLAPFMPTDTLLVADLDFCAPVFVPVVFNENTGGMQNSMDGVDVLWQPTAITGASYGGYFYTQYGLSVGPEEMHGKLTGLQVA